MRSQFVVGSIVLGIALTATAQLASSHAPTTSLPPAQVTAPNVSGKAVVNVNGAVLTDRDLLREEYAIFPYARIHKGFPKSLEPEIRKGALDMIVFEELVYQEALRRKMTVPTARLNHDEAEFERRFPNKAEFEQYLKVEMKGSRRFLREDIRRSLLIDAFLKSELVEKSKVSEAEAKAYYEKHPAQFSHPETFTIQTISVIPPAKPTQAVKDEARKRAEDALRQAKATKNYQEFGLLAERISEDDYRVNMGDRHAVDRAKLPPQIVEAALAMKPGQVSDLIQLGDAFTLFRLNAHDPAGEVKFETIKTKLMSDMRKSKYNELRSELDQRLRKGAKIQIL